jgi:hypothetical protein
MEEEEEMKNKEEESWRGQLTSPWKGEKAILVTEIFSGFFWGYFLVHSSLMIDFTAWENKIQTNKDNVNQKKKEKKNWGDDDMCVSLRKKSKYIHTEVASGWWPFLAS